MTAWPRVQQKHSVKDRWSVLKKKDRSHYALRQTKRTEEKLEDVSVREEAAARSSRPIERKVLMKQA